MLPPLPSALFVPGDVVVVAVDVGDVAVAVDGRVGVAVVDAVAGAEAFAVAVVVAASMAALVLVAVVTAAAR